MKTLRRFKLTLTLRGPVLVNSSAPSIFGVDAAVARNLKGQPYVPGTLIKGKTREALEQIEEAHGLESLLGARSKGDDDEPERGSLIIGDLVAQDGGRTQANRQRVSLDHTLGSAKGEMLRVIETPYLAGDEVVFSGAAHCFADEKEAKEIARKLRLGLRWLTQIGSLRTTGFGRVRDADVQVEPAAPVTVSVRSPAPAALSIALFPDGPLCVSRHKIGDNLFESDDVIPGNMLAGAVMQVATELGIDNQLPDFHKIRFRHAFPTTGPERPRALPLSVVKAGKIPYDITDFKDPVLLLDDKGNFTAPAFPLDWKRHDDVLNVLGWADPLRELRVRTAIDSRKRTADRGTNGEGGKLFAFEVVHPVTTSQTTIAWRSQIDLTRVADRRAAANALVNALAQLAFVSKTKVNCRVEWTEVEKPAPALQLVDGERLALVLQTPALLADPRFQSVPDIPRAGTISAKQMLDLYSAAWNEISGHSLALEYHFAQQFLAGGNYLARRFQNGKAYDPWLLTREGSVFVFTVKDATQATERLETWFAGGLDLPQWAIDRYGDDWRKNPYRPENGFGEIAVHTRDFATPTAKPVDLAEAVLS